MEKAKAELTEAEEQRQLGNLETATVLAQLAIGNALVALAEQGPQVQYERGVIAQEPQFQSMNEMGIRRNRQSRRDVTPPVGE